MSSPMPIRFAEKSISFLLEVGMDDAEKAKIIDDQVASIQLQAGFQKKKWNKLKITSPFLQHLCQEILKKHIENTPPDFSTKRLRWTELFFPGSVRETSKNVVTKIRVVLSSAQTSCYEVLIWKQKKQKSIIESIREVKTKNLQEGRPSPKESSKRLSIKEIKIQDEPIKQDDEEDNTGSGTLKRTIIRKNNERYKAFMLTFHRKTPSQPVLRPINILLTPSENKPMHDKQLKLIQWEGVHNQKKKHHGASNLAAYGYLTEMHRTGDSQVRNLMEVRLKPMSLRSVASEIGSTDPKLGIIPIMKDIISTFIPKDEQKQVVWRRLSMSFIKIHEEINALGEKVYRAWIPNNDFKCDEGTVLDDSKWVLRFNVFNQIDYISPENLKNLSFNGAIENYRPNVAEDIWAAGIIFFQVAWKGQEPDFLVDLRELSLLAANNPVYDEFEKKKQEILTQFSPFYEKYNAETNDDPLKNLIIQMLNPDSQKRINAKDCLNRLNTLGV